MKLRELKQIIKEEIQSVLRQKSALKEFTDNNFQAPTPTPPLPPAILAKLLPKTSKTVKAAEARIKSFNNGTMFEHVQYFEVQPHGNMPNRPKYRLGQSQYWLNEAQLRMRGKDPSQKVNVTLVTVRDITDGRDNKLGAVYVDTDVFLKGVPVVFNVLQRQS